MNSHDLRICAIFSGFGRWGSGVLTLLALIWIFYWYQFAQVCAILYDFGGINKWPGPPRGYPSDTPGNPAVPWSSQEAPWGAPRLPGTPEHLGGPQSTQWCPNASGVHQGYPREYLGYRGTPELPGSGSNPYIYNMSQMQSWSLFHDWGIVLPAKQYRHLYFVHNYRYWERDISKLRYAIPNLMINL